MKYSFLVCIAALIVLDGCGPEKPAQNKAFLDLNARDTTVDPGTNFFMYASGKWYDSVKIPSTETGVGSFYDLNKETRRKLKTILDSASNASNPNGSIAQKVGDFYASGTDSLTIEKRGYEPIKTYLDQIAKINNINALLVFVTAQQVLNQNLLFLEGFGADQKNSTINIAMYSQGGLGLPDRDYYFRDDPATHAIVDAYKTFMHKLYALTGDDSLSASKKVDKVYSLEKQMAGSHRTRTELRDPQSNYHKMAVADLDKKMPVFAWKKTLDGLGVHADSVNVRQPAYYEKLNALLKSVPLDTWKDYLRFHTIAGYANALPHDFVAAAFDYGKTVTGQDKEKPRWERIANKTDALLGEALGQLYVKKYFPPKSKERMLELVNNLQKAFAVRIDHLDWMSDSTKVQAKAKLTAFIKKIGYPDKWRDYSNVTIKRDAYFENLISCNQADYQHEVVKVGKPVDRTEWGMTPPTINAYYNPTFNEIVFPAGILQPPFFDPDADDAVNYGAIGAGIGHEMTHGFDDNGSQYDKEGNLKNWWSKEDSIRFHAKTKAVVDLYNSFIILDSLHINGQLTNGENIADIGGLAIAYDAFKMTPQGQDTTRIDGLTPDQRFFLSFSAIWRMKIKDALARMFINTNPHSPAMWRVNGACMNTPPFYNAFHIPAGTPMHPNEDSRIKIW